MAPARQLYWSEPSIRDMSNISCYIALSSLKSADRLLERIAARAHLLLARPQMGRVGVRSDTRELVVHPHYVIIYRLSSDRVTILRVKHTATKLPA